MIGLDVDEVIKNTSQNFGNHCLGSKISEAPTTVNWRKDAQLLLSQKGVF
jgi:hypothetical protein